ncbi:ASST-domain-containing protein [Aspergillus floccosus]
MVMDLKVQHYRGQDYLTFWAGEDDGTRGIGSYYMLNSSYEVAHVVSAANGHDGDVHEFRITDHGTALLTIYEIVPADLTPVGGPADGWIYDGLFQEIDIDTGALLFEWRARDHHAIDESYYPLDEDAGTPTAPFDYFHINSVDKHPATGNYLVSSRYLHTVTCVAPTGDILWILGGKRNMFNDDGVATSFTWQHDARWLSSTEISLLDNGAHEHLRTSDHSRGYRIALDLDPAARSASVTAVYHAPGRFSAHSQGNLQRLPASQNVFVGWGKAAAFTEFDADGGEVLCHAHYAPRVFFWFGWVKSYRVFKASRWTGRPTLPPDVAVDDAARMVYVSWNGATDVAGWVLQAHAEGDSAGDSKGSFRTVQYVPKRGFETALDVAGVDGYLRVVAVGFDGEEMESGVSQVFTVSHGTSTDTLGAVDEPLQHALVGACALGAVLAACWRSRRMRAWCHSLRARIQSF